MKAYLIEAEIYSFVGAGGSARQKFVVIAESVSDAERKLQARFKKPNSCGTIYSVIDLTAMVIQ